MAIDLSKVTNRDKLATRRDPYWQRLRPGCFIGYRPAAKGGAGTWVGRAADEDSKWGYRFKALGDFGDLPAADRFAAAKAAAEAFAVEVERGDIPDADAEQIETVEQACRAYAKVNAEAAGRFERHIYADPIARVKLAKLKRGHLVAWRQRLADKPASVSRSKTGPEVTRPRSASTVNRDVAMIRAALHKVVAPGTPNTESAWQEALIATPNADGQRTLYLDKGQRRRLLDNLDAEALPFVKTLCLLPLRPGAAAQLTVKEWEPRTRQLTVGKDKNGKPRRVMLPADVAALLTEQAKDKLPGATLLTRANGKPWNKDNWNDPIVAAIEKVNAAEPKNKLPAATAYTLRHSTITDLALGGLPLLTIAQISGTSVEMIERHYGQLTSGAAVEALAGLAL
jgi:integrase